MEKRHTLPLIENLDLRRRVEKRIADYAPKNAVVFTPQHAKQIQHEARKTIKRIR